MMNASAHIHVYCMKSRGERRNYIKLAGEWCVCVEMGKC